MKKIAIAVLTRGYNDLGSYNKLITRNALIYDKLTSNSKFNYDVVIFHEGNITEEHQAYISNNSKLPLIFKDVKQSGDRTAFDDSKNIVNTELCPPTELSSKFALGYKHMCYFWSINLFNYLSEYEYVIRMDEDVFLDAIDPALIEEIIDGDIKFAIPYMCDSLDHPDVIVGLEKLLNKFYVDNNITPQVSYKDIYAPNTNFMILNLQYFKNHTTVQNFLSEIDKSHGIYSNRWGDAPIWGIILYALQEEAFYLCDTVSYFHESHGHHVNKPKPFFY